MIETSRTKRYANSARRREEILDAATALFVRSGFGAVSLRDIAESARISHPGLLRHFADKAAVLDAVVDRFEKRNEAWIAERGGFSARIEDLAWHNAAIPGYLELFTMLAGQATSPSHPAHERMKSRYERLRRQSAAYLGARGVEGDPLDAATALGAGWDGLQLMSLYAPDAVDVPAHIAARVAWMCGDRTRAVSPDGAGTPSPPITTDGLLSTAAGGYAKGRLRREEIVADAAVLFAREGYHGTAMQEIADAVGIAKTSLLHHFPAKADLLTAVLLHRDRSTVPLTVRSDDPRGELLSIGDDARRSELEMPGLISLYAVLSCEAAAPHHPAHAYFARRFSEARSHVTGLLRRIEAHGQLASGVDPQRDAVWLVALWDGLQIQWLYDPQAIDIPKLLSAYARSLVID